MIKFISNITDKILSFYSFVLSWIVIGVITLIFVGIGLQLFGVI